MKQFFIHLRMGTSAHHNTHFLYACLWKQSFQVNSKEQPVFTYKNTRASIMGQQAKPLPVTHPTSPLSASFLSRSSSQRTHLGRWQKIIQVPGPLSSKWESQMEFQEALAWTKPGCGSHLGNESVGRTFSCFCPWPLANKSLKRIFFLKSTLYKSTSYTHSANIYFHNVENKTLENEGFM